MQNKLTIPGIENAVELPLAPEQVQFINPDKVYTYQKPGHFPVRAFPALLDFSNSTTGVAVDANKRGLIRLSNFITEQGGILCPITKLPGVLNMSQLRMIDLAVKEAQKNLGPQGVVVPFTLGKVSDAGVRALIRFYSLAGDSASIQLFYDNNVIAAQTRVLSQLHEEEQNSPTES